MTDAGMGGEIGSFEGSDEYVAEHVREALTIDPRVSEPELQVTMAAGKVIVSGTVPTAERREAVSRVLAELLPDRVVVNHTTVQARPVEQEPEQLS